MIEIRDQDGELVATINDKRKPIRVNVKMDEALVPEAFTELLGQRTLPFVSGGEGDLGTLITTVVDARKGTMNWMQALLDHLARIELRWERI